MAAIAEQEIEVLCRRAINGEINVSLADKAKTWDAEWCGEVGFLLDGWQVVFFNRCGDLKYTDSAISPDGRHAGYDEWSGCPLIPLSEDDYRALEDLLRKAS